jgi:hypothetical protein
MLSTSSCYVNVVFSTMLVSISVEKGHIFAPLIASEYKITYRIMRSLEAWTRAYLLNLQLSSARSAARRYSPAQIGCLISVSDVLPIRM